MVNPILSNMAQGIRWDILITLIGAIALEIVLMNRRKIKNRRFKNKKEIFIWLDFVFSMVTSATIYGGISAIYFAIKGKLLFEQNMIISEEYIILFAGMILIGLGITTYKNAIKKLK